MKKKLLIILSIIVLIIGGYFVLNEFNKKHLVTEVQEKAEEYLIENYEDIESVEITPDNYRVTPMGTTGVGGHINNEDHLTIYITFLIDGNEVGEQRTITKPSDFPDEKERCVEEPTKTRF